MATPRATGGFSQQVGGVELGQGVVEVEGGSLQVGSQRLELCRVEGSNRGGVGSQ